MPNPRRGAGSRQFRRMVLAESLRLSVIGLVQGFLADLGLGYAPVVAMSAVGWPMPYAPPGEAS